MAFINYIRSRRPALLALLLLSVLLLGVTSGCGVFTQPPQVAGNAEQALKEGETKEADARSAEKNGDKTEATERWQKVASYYAAVAGKFAGTENGFRAALAQAHALDRDPHNTGMMMGADRVLKTALRQYKSADFPQIHQEAEAYSTELHQRLDLENSKSFYYKIMDIIVRMFGNDPKVSPVVAIFFIAIAVTLLVWPFRVMQYRSFKETQRWQPELAKLQAKYKDNPSEFMTVRQAFMKQHGINEFAGCLPLLLQWPVTLLMYNVILHYQFHFSQATFLWINPAAGELATRLPFPFTGFFGHHLGENDMLMLIVYAGSMYLTTKLMPSTPATDPQQAEQQKTMTVMMPAIFFIMMLQWQPASAFVLYWFTSNVLALGQQWIIYRTLPTPPPLIINNGGDAADSGEGKGGDNPRSGPGGTTLTANPKLVSPKNKRK
jgi:YidC/Oxa1 family membrane protein insertase